jgi:ligand-binding SRPBCC domain-containing protein
MITAPLERVWAFHQKTRESLPALSPPEDDVRIECADEAPRVGGRVIIHARWEARFVELVPPHAVVFGEEARFVDEQVSGPFKFWRHAHEFERVDDRTTRLLDTLTYRLPLGPLGWLADRLFVARKIRAMFRYRHAALKRLLESA